MSGVGLLVGCFVLGIVAKRFSSLPRDSQKGINAWVLYVSMPALVIRVIHSVPLTNELVWAVLGLWLVFAVPAVVALQWAKRAPVQRNAFAGAMALCAGLGNTAFVGYPLLGLLGGPAAVGIGAVVDQLGTFVMLAVGAVPLATHLSGRDVSPRVVLRRLLTFPPLLALGVAVASRGFDMPVMLDEVLERLAGMVTPLALASVGWQFEPSTLRGNGRWVAFGLAFKLVAAPLLVLGMMRLVHAEALVARVAVAQAAMAPMVTAGVLADEFNLDARLAAALIAVGTPLSLVTVPMWWWALS
jgi:predicted permease